jgi:hypothetical protein
MTPAKRRNASVLAIFHPDINDACDIGMKSRLKDIE